MNDQPDLTQPADDVTALAALEQTASALVDPTIAADVIEQGLNFIYTNEGEHLEAVLDDIQLSVNALVANADDLGAKLQAAVAMAKTLREQRESARQALQDLQDAIVNHDLSHPEIDGLIDSLTESITWEIEEQIWDVLWEHVIDRITDESPLDYTQANHLLDILTGGEVAHDSPVWREITEWIDFVDQQSGYIE